MPPLGRRGKLIVAGRFGTFARRPERLGNGLNDYGSNVAYVIPDSGFQLGQNRIQFALILGGNSPISE
jgi:hypothetical protein